MSGPDNANELRLTAEEFAEGKADDFGDIEIVRGLVVKMMAQSPLHSRVVRRLAGALEARSDLCRIYAESLLKVER